MGFTLRGRLFSINLCVGRIPGFLKGLEGRSVKRHASEAACPPLPHPTYQAAAAALDGKIYVIGGQQTRRTVQILDLSNNTWSQGPELSCKRYSAAAAVVGSRLYVAGGVDASGSILSSMECWSPQSAQACSWGPDSGQRRSHHAAVELEGKLVLLGGHDGSQFLTHVQRFDAGSQRWEQLPPLRERKKGLAAAVLGGKLFAVGGYNGGNPLSSVEVFDPADGGWSPGPSLGRARDCHAAAAVAGRLYVIGGDSSDTRHSTEVFEESAGSWAEGPALKHPREFSAAAVWDGTLYVLGGEDSQSRTSVEVLPSAETRMRRALALLNGVPPSEAAFPALQHPTVRAAVPWPVGEKQRSSEASEEGIVSIGASDVVHIQNGILMASKRLSQAHFEVVDPRFSPKLPAGVTPLSPILRLVPHGRFQEPVLLLLPITGEIGVEAAKAWRSKPCGNWELLAPEVIKGAPSKAIKEGSLLRFSLEHFCYWFAGVVHNETSVSPPPPPWPPAEDEDVKCGKWPLVENASRFSCCPRRSFSR